MPSKENTPQEQILEIVFSLAEKEGFSRVEIEQMLAEGMSAEDIIYAIDKKKKEKDAKESAEKQKQAEKRKSPVSEDKKSKTEKKQEKKSESKQVKKEKFASKTKKVVKKVASVSLAKVSSIVKQKNPAKMPKVSAGKSVKGDEKFAKKQSDDVRKEVFKKTGKYKGIEAKVKSEAKSDTTSPGSHG